MSAIMSAFFFESYTIEYMLRVLIGNYIRFKLYIICKPVEWCQRQRINYDLLSF